VQTNRPRLAVAGATLASLALLGGSVGAGVASAHAIHRAGGTVTLQFWNAYNTTDAEASTMANIIIPKFEAEHPGIKVVSDVYPYGELLSKIIASASAGDPPDIVRSDIIWVPQLAKEGVLLPLSSVMPDFKALSKTVYAGSLSTNYYKGQYYGLPLDTNTMVLFWNKADFAAAGIKEPPTTLKQIFADAVRLTNPAKKQYGLDVQGTDMWDIDPLIWSGGGSITNGSFTKAEGYLNSAKTVAVLNSIVRLLKEGDVNPDVLGGTGTVGGESAFPKGISAMYLDGPWGSAFYQKSDPHLQYGMEVLPHSVVGGEDVVIPAGTKHRADAELFAQFLLSPFSQNEMAKAGQMSVLKNASASETKIESYYAPFAKQLLTAEARIPSPVYTQIDTDFSNDLQAALRGKESTSAAMNQAAQQAQALLDQDG
jgi:multiple sugar transport system substrate-binding protein